jgi:hypothetical protein
VRRACEAVEEPLSLSNWGFFNREEGTDSPFYTSMNRLLKIPLFPDAENERSLTDALCKVARGEMSKFEQNIRYHGHGYSLVAYSSEKDYFTLIVRESSGYGC